MNTSRRLVASAVTMGLGLTLWGCSTDTLISEQPVPNGALPLPLNGPVSPKFDPITPGGGLGLIPIPNDILRDSAPGPNQGKNLNVPPGSDPADSLRSLRGFSTTGNIIIPFDGKINANTVSSQTIMVIEGEGSKDPVGSTGSNATIACNITVLNPEGSASAANSTVVLQPVLPLKPITNYYVVITAGVQAGDQSIGNPKTGGARSVNTGLLTKSTSPLVDANGNSLVFPVSNSDAAKLESLRQFYQIVWGRAESILGTPRANIPFAFRFGTQPLFATLASKFNPLVTDPPNGNPGLRGLASIDEGTSPPLPAAVGAGLNNSLTGPIPALGGANGRIPLAESDVGRVFGASQSVDAFYASLTAADPVRFPATTAHSNIARIYTGTITCANYIGPNGYFVGENLPIAGNAPFQRFGDLTVTWYACLPTLPPIPFGPPFLALPVKSVIYQHGLDHDKRDMFLIADKLCQNGFGVIGIDLFRHGDLATPGKPFVDPTNMRATRDNIRQSISNLFYVSEAICGPLSGRSNFDGFPAPNALPPSIPPAPENQVPEFNTPLSTSPVVNGPGPAFIGHSVGGIVGVPFTAVTPFSSRSIINAAGGRVTELFLSSVPRGTVLKTQLAAAGIVQGTESFLQFFFVLQTVLDDVDPLNYAAVTFRPAATLATDPAPPATGFKPIIPGLGQQAAQVLLQEITGDQTMPNFSTQDLARAYGQFVDFKQVNPVVTAVQFLASVASPFVGRGYFQFAAGMGHEAILNLDGGATETVRTQILTFLNTANPAPFASPGQIVAP